MHRYCLSRYLSSRWMLCSSLLSRRIRCSATSSGDTVARIEVAVATDHYWIMDLKRRCCGAHQSPSGQRTTISKQLTRSVFPKPRLLEPVWFLELCEVNAGPRLGLNGSDLLGTFE